MQRLTPTSDNVEEPVVATLITARCDVGSEPLSNKSARRLLSDLDLAWTQSDQDTESLLMHDADAAEPSNNDAVLWPLMGDENMLWLRSDEGMELMLMHDGEL